MNIDRNALHGRNWEGFGADPYLSGENSFYYVQGLQDQGVVATAKHYICNEQESNRTYYPKTGPSQVIQRILMIKQCMKSIYGHLHRVLQLVSVL